MKPARREISIFNVSTIDLFASALGAFMVVSFVLLPYFPNTGNAPATPDPEPPAAPTPTPEPAPPPSVPQAEHDALGNRLEDAEAARDELRRQLADAEAARNNALDRERELQQALADAGSTIQKLPAIDLVIALDTTSSMTREVTSLREEIAGLAELLLELSEDAAVGIIEFKDRCDPASALRVASIQRIDRQSVQQLTAFARSMSAGSSPCNDSADEDFAEALRAATDLNWRTAADRHSIVMISDSPAHEDMVEQALADARRFATRTGARHTVSTVFVDTSDVAPSHPYIAYTVAFMRRVAETGRGEFVQANENASLSLTILHALFGD